MLEAAGITYAYRTGARPIIQGVSIRIASGERVHLTAPSGAGKTTLCRLLAGYLVPREGRILVDGEPLPKRGMCPVQLIGQHPERMLDPRMRMRDSLMEAIPARAGSADRTPDPALLERLGIQERWLTRFPHELSGGELQRFCIARALLAEPRYLIADEISTMLDAITQARIWRVLLDEARARNLGLLLTTHSPGLAEHLATRTVDLSSLRPSGSDAS